MKTKIAARLLGVIGTVLCFYSQAPGQAAAPTPEYSGSFGGGLALTGGNTVTKNFNLAFSLVHDPMTKNVQKITALYLRGSQNKVLSLDRSSVVLRDEYKLSGRTFLFGQADYIRDRFKDIRYLFAPVGGAGYKLVDSDRTKVQVSGGAGGIWEKNLGLPLKKSGSLNAGQSFSQKISTTSTITESIATLWKTQDYSDSLTSFSAGLSTSISKKLELKLEFLDSYKNKLPNPAFKKNDTTLVVTFLLKY